MKAFREWIAKHRWALLGALLPSFLTGVAIGNTALPGVNNTLNTVFTYAYEVSPDKPTYSATSGAITLATNPQAVCALSGSATKLIRVRRLFWSATITTAAVETFDVIIRTAAYTAGNGTQPTINPVDTTSAAATAVMEIWTANPTTGAGNILRDLPMVYSAITSPQAIDAPREIQFGWVDQAIILRNANQWAEVNLNGSAMAGGVGYCTWEWTEE